MAGVEVEKTLPNTEEKTMTEMPKETVHTTDDSVTAVEVEIKEEEEVPKVEKEAEKTETAPVKEEKPVENPAAVEEKDVKPAAEEKKTVEVKTA
ncbi:hypothetical protein Bca52824_023734 [Brassica carinata]|uniref:Uncharacterized protein n=1 Tax=Brassica carinata TaxID=52824 RepID=A0A8X8AW03_BRACI|nr:hypothetical protein Bca52824_023734 [Brassica carinata]